MIYNNDKYGGGGRGGAFRVKNHVMSLGSPVEYLLKQEDSSELTLAFVIMPIIANKDKMYSNNDDDDDDDDDDDGGGGGGDPPFHVKNHVMSLSSPLNAC